MEYSFKRNIDMVNFLKSVDSCLDTVLLKTTEGDTLNLQSQLSKFVFLSTALDYSYLNNCSISCTPKDAQTLSEFIIL
ncbi:MAG: polya polymerase [Lachnospiraceae bacterium]|nr:polya polymerase [Lachnospiraceae bacterium]